MRRIEFGKRNRSGNLLHVEAPGCIVNIRVGLTDAEGREVTRVDVLPEDETRSPDPDGYYWRQTPGDARVIRDAERYRHEPILHEVYGQRVDPDTVTIDGATYIRKPF